MENLTQPAQALQNTQPPRPAELNTISKTWEISDPDGRGIATVCRLCMDYSPEYLEGPGIEGRDRHTELEELMRDVLADVAHILTG